MKTYLAIISTLFIFIGGYLVLRTGPKEQLDSTKAYKQCLATETILFNNKDINEYINIEIASLSDYKNHEYVDAKIRYATGAEGFVIEKATLKVDGGSRIKVCENAPFSIEFKDIRPSPYFVGKVRKLRIIPICIQKNNKSKEGLRNFYSEYYILKALYKTRLTNYNYRLVNVNFIDINTNIRKEYKAMLREPKKSLEKRCSGDFISSVDFEKLGYEHVLKYENKMSRYLAESLHKYFRNADYNFEKKQNLTLIRDKKKNEFFWGVFDFNETYFEGKGKFLYGEILSKYIRTIKNKNDAKKVVSFLLKNTSMFQQVINNSLLDDVGKEELISLIKLNSEELEKINKNMN
jgi:hypothetical protein